MTIVDPEQVHTNGSCCHCGNTHKIREAVAAASEDCYNFETETTDVKKGPNASSL